MSAGVSEELCPCPCRGLGSLIPALLHGSKKLQERQAEAEHIVQAVQKSL